MSRRFSLLVALVETLLFFAMFLVMRAVLPLLIGHRGRIVADSDRLVLKGAFRRG